MTRRDDLGIIIVRHLNSKIATEVRQVGDRAVVILDLRSSNAWVQDHAWLTWKRHSGHRAGDLPASATVIARGGEAPGPETA